MSAVGAAQQNDPGFYTPDPVKTQQFLPYLEARHGGKEGLADWKEANSLAYFRELWYFTESFTVVRDHLAEGVHLDESIVDISRFERHRLPDSEAIVVLPGFRDVLKLKAGKELLHKPEYLK